MAWKSRLKSISAAELAKLLAGNICGDSSAVLHGLCPVNDPLPDCVSFLTDTTAGLANRTLNNSVLSALIVADEAADLSPNPGKCFIIVADPRKVATRLTQAFCEKVALPGTISDKADISASAKIGKNVFIGAFAVIGDDVVIDNDVVIYPQVVIYEGSKIGARSTIHAHAVIREHTELGPDTVIQNGAIIGADGFGYIPDSAGTLHCIPQVGKVRLAAKVEIGANTCIDRATLGQTSVEEGSKIDNLVQIGHNVRIGRHAIVCGQSAIAGSVTIGNHAVLGGNVGVADHLNIPDGSRLAARTGLTQNIEKAGDYCGWPALPIKDWHRLHVLQRWLIPHTRKLKSLLGEK